MSDDRLSRIENHLPQLIDMVAQNNRAIDELRRRMDEIGERMDKLERRMDDIGERMEKLEQRLDSESMMNAKRHLETMQKFRHVNADISYLDEQVARHE
jgi:chromosome segregation ATPase